MKKCKITFNTATNCPDPVILDMTVQICELGTTTVLETLNLGDTPTTVGLTGTVPNLEVDYSVLAQGITVKYVDMTTDCGTTVVGQSVDHEPAPTIATLSYWADSSSRNADGTVGSDGDSDDKSQFVDASYATGSDTWTMTQYYKKGPGGAVVGATSTVLVELKDKATGNALGSGTYTFGDSLGSPTSPTGTYAAFAAHLSGIVGDAQLASFDKGTWAAANNFGYWDGTHNDANAVNGATAAQLDERTGAIELALCITVTDSDDGNTSVNTDNEICIPRVLDLWVSTSLPYQYAPSGQSGTNALDYTVIDTHYPLSGAFGTGPMEPPISGTSTSTFTAGQSVDFTAFVAPATVAGTSGNVAQQRWWDITPHDTNPGAPYPHTNEEYIETTLKHPNFLKSSGGTFLVGWQEAGAQDDKGDKFPWISDHGYVATPGAADVGGDYSFFTGWGLTGQYNPPALPNPPGTLIANNMLITLDGTSIPVTSVNPITKAPGVTGNIFEGAAYTQTLTGPQIIQIRSQADFNADFTPTPVVMYVEGQVELNYRS